MPVSIIADAAACRCRNRMDAGHNWETKKWAPFLLLLSPILAISKLKLVSSSVAAPFILPDSSGKILALVRRKKLHFPSADGTGSRDFALTAQYKK